MPQKASTVPDLKSYLQGELTTSAYAAVTETVYDAHRAVSTDAISAKAEIAAATMKAVGMMEELRLFVLLLTSIFGRKGLRLSEVIVSMIAPVAVAPAPARKLEPATKVAQIRTRPAPPPSGDFGQKMGEAAAVLGLNGGTQPPTAPARQLEPESVDTRFENWLRGLRRVVEGKIEGGLRDFYQALQVVTQGIVDAGHKLEADNWQLLFSAMKEARKSGNYIVGNSCKPAIFFKSAPTNLLQESLFGTDGVVVSVTAEVADCGELLPLWLPPKAGIGLDMVSALKGRVTVDEIDLRKLRRLKKVVDEKGNVPDWLTKKFESLAIGEEPEVTPPPPPTPIPEVKANGGQPADEPFPPPGVEKKEFSKGERKRMAKEAIQRRAAASVAPTLPDPVVH